MRSQGTSGGSAAFHLVRVNDAMISGVMMVNDTINVTSYAIFADACNTTSVVGCNVYSYSYAFLTNGSCRSIVTSSCTFVNCGTQVLYGSATTDSRSFGHVRFNNPANEVDQNGANRMSAA